MAKVHLVQYQLDNCPDYASAQRWITELAFSRLTDALYAAEHNRVNHGANEGLRWKVQTLEVV